MEKQCTRCGETKPLSEFKGAPRGKMGRTSICAVCIRARDKARNKMDDVVRIDGLIIPPDRRPFLFEEGQIVSVVSDGERFTGKIVCTEGALCTMQHRHGWKQSFRKLDYEVGVIEIKEVQTNAK